MFLSEFGYSELVFLVDPLHPAGKTCQFCQGEENCLRAGENIFDLHVCTHGRRVGAEQLYVSRTTKVVQMVMVLGRQQSTSCIVLGDKYRVPM